MGFPQQSNYTVLRSLSLMNSYENESPFRHHDRKLTHNAINSLRDFNLFAFVLYDPDRNPGFGRNLSEIFSILDHATGSELLFFALVKPKHDWEFRNSQRDYYKAFRRIEEHNNSLLSESVDYRDESAAMFALCNALNIPMDELPVIVVTNDFLDRNYFWIKTSTNTIQTQLNLLGYLAHTNPSIKSDWRYAKRVITGELNRLDLCNCYEFESNANRLAKVLSDVLSFVVYDYSSESDKEIAKIQIRNAVQTTKEKIKRIRISSNEVTNDDELAEVPAEQLLNLAINLSLLSERNRVHRESILHEEVIEIIEPYSRQLLRTAESLVNMLEYDRYRMQDILWDEERFDHSPIVICLAKLFEYEVNLSFVHWMRKNLGVRLPEYFNKFDPQASALYFPENMGFPHPRPIDFNRGYNWRWIAPGLGQSLLSLSSESRSEDFPIRFRYLSIENFRRFETKWDEMKKIRNQAAHSSVLDRTSLHRTKQLLNSIHSLGIFHTIHDLKRDFRRLQ